MNVIQWDKCPFISLLCDNWSHFGVVISHLMYGQLQTYCARSDEFYESSKCRKTRNEIYTRTLIGNGLKVMLSTQAATMNILSNITSTVSKSVPKKFVLRYLFYCAFHLFLPLTSYLLITSVIKLQFILYFYHSTVHCQTL